MARQSKIVESIKAGAGAAHPMIGVMESSGPIVKEEPKPLDVTEGKRFGADIIARCKADSLGWAPIGLKLASGTAEFRAGVVAALKAERAVLKATATIAHLGDDAKTKAAGSANTKLSEVSTICAAFNARGTVQGAMEHHVHKAPKKPEDLSFDDWLTYARYIKGDEARGRPMDTLMVSFAKWFKREQEKDQTRTPEEKNLMQALAKMIPAAE